MIPIAKVRQEPREKKRMIALVLAGVIVALIFAIWVVTLKGRLNTAQIVEEEVYKPTITESIKRKANLLFGDLDFPQIGSPVEYKQGGNIKTPSVEETEEKPKEKPVIVDEETKTTEAVDNASFEDLINELIEEENNPS